MAARKNQGAGKPASKPVTPAKKAPVKKVAPAPAKKPAVKKPAPKVEKPIAKKPVPRKAVVAKPKVAPAPRVVAPPPVETPPSSLKPGEWYPKWHLRGVPPEETPEEIAAREAFKSDFYSRLKADEVLRLHLSRGDAVENTPWWLGAGVGLVFAGIIASLGYYGAKLVFP